MIHEYRRYRIKAGMMPAYLEHFEKVGIPVLKRHLHLLGFWVNDTGELGWVHHLWAHESPNDRATRFAALKSDPEWVNDFLPKAYTMVDEMQSTLLNPVGFSASLPLGSEPVWTPMVDKTA